MRSYYIDELSRPDILALKQRLDAMDLNSGMEDLYWLPVPESMLNAEQKAHAPYCGPYAMALELVDSGLRLEFLVRARSRIACRCVQYASPELTAHMMRYIDGMLDELRIRS